MQKHFFIWDNSRDAVIWITLMLLAIGCINVFSASFVEATDMFGDGYFYLKRYVAFAAVGFAVMLYLGLRGPDYHLWLSKHWLNIIYVAVLFLLIAVELMGVTTKGAQRWLYIGPFSLQPSELAKLAVIMVCAGELGKRLKNICARHCLIILIVKLWLCPLLMAYWCLYSRIWARRRLLLRFPWACIFWRGFRCVCCCF